MKKHLFTILVTVCAAIMFGQSIPNGGFENWQTTTYQNPEFYITSNLHGNHGNIGPVNAIKTNDAYHGNYAIKLTTELSGADTVFAYFANGDPGKNPPTDGTPFNQIPTGIRLHYKSDIMFGDSALVLVQFKKNGALLAQYFWAISSTQSSYTAFSKNFIPALPSAPDTVVIGIASSFPFGGNRGIPGTMIQVDSISFTGVANQPLNFNGDLESWQTFNYAKIAGWQISGNNVGDNFQTVDKYSGSYAIELQSRHPSFGGGGNQAAYATTGRFTNNGPPQGGLPYQQQIDTLVFYYKYLPADPNDSANVSINFKLGGSHHYGIQKFLHVSGGYQKVKIPFNIPVSAPDTVIIGLASSSYTSYPIPNSYVGSDLKVDNMYFTSQKIPVANFNLPVSGCVGQTIQLTDNSENMVSGWNWIMPGGTPPSQFVQNPQVTYASPGTKTITLYATNLIDGNNNTSPAFSRTIAIYSIPTINVTSASICSGSTATLVASGATSFSWSTGQNTASITVNPAATTVYNVTGTSNGCSNTSMGVVVVAVASAPDICMVSTDSASVNNVIYWDKLISTKIDSFIIYREVTTGTYARIGGQKYSELSQFTDTSRHIGPSNGDPNIGTYRYKLQIKDSCGGYSPLSLYHNSIYFNNNSGTFTWNTYDVEGQVTPVSQFNLLRDNTNTGIWLSIGTVAGSQNILNDPNYAAYASSANWRVEALGFSCNPTARITQTYNKTKSNVRNNFVIPTGMENQLFSNRFNISPNPAKSELHVMFSNTSNTTTEFTVSDVLGHVVYKTIITEGNELSIPVNELSTGVYFVKLQQGKNTTVKKFIKE